jgi:carbamoyl-phosphate synthase large subunit
VERLAKYNLTPRTKQLSREEDVEDAFASLGSPLWVRARMGAGGLGGLKCQSAEEAKTWIKVWQQKKGKKLSDFIIQEYLPGRDIAWDSLWKNGKLITSYTRERLEYAFKHLTFSGVAGTPSVARIIHDERVSRVAFQAVKLIDESPNGIYCVDLREDVNGMVKVTEVGAKVHTTLGLWSYACVKVLKLPWYANIPYLYVHLAFNGEVPDLPPFDLYPEGYYLLRHIDSGAILWRENGWKKRVPL